MTDLTILTLDRSTKALAPDTISALRAKAEPSTIALCHARRF
jgi:hypothetical protein